MIAVYRLFLYTITMLSRLNRFHGHGGVRRVYRLGKPTRSGHMSMHTLKDDRVKSTRVAVVVSRKVDKSAVKRNRIRRRVYEQVREFLWEVYEPTEIVFTVYSNEVATMPVDELKATIKEFIQKAKS